MVESKGERACRDYFERRYGLPFVRCRPDWLGGLELDGYNESLGLAFEYNGRQHYTYTPHFHRGTCEQFHDQVRRDNVKLKTCVRHGVRLVVVPDLKVDDIPTFLDLTLPTEPSGDCCCVIL